MSISSIDFYLSTPWISHRLRRGNDHPPDDTKYNLTRTVGIVADHQRPAIDFADGVRETEDGRDPSLEVGGRRLPGRFRVNLLGRIGGHEPERHPPSEHGRDPL